MQDASSRDIKMRRFSLFLLILITTLISLTVLIVAGMFVFSAAQQSPYSWMSGMWGEGAYGMMSGAAVQNPALPYFGAAFVVLVCVAVIGLVGSVYYVVVPEIHAGIAHTICENDSQVGVVQNEEPTCTPLGSVVKTLNNEERQIIEVLNAHNGEYLQKYIRNEAGLSRLKTHRILARLAERGIVTLERTGNTNQVVLADWLKK